MINAHLLRRRTAARLGGVRLLAPLGGRDFRLLWSGQAVSLIGDGAFVVAITVLTASISSGASPLAAVWLAWSLAVVACSLAGGVVADRLDRRRVLVAADAARFVAVGGLAAAAATGAAEVWHCAAAAAVVGAGEAFAHPALSALVPAVVAEDRLAQANALDQLLRPLCFRALGPALGGGLAALAGPALVLAFDAATFAAGAACAAAIATPARAVRTAAPAAAAELRAGVRYVASERWLWVTLLAAAVSLMCFWGPIEVLLPVVVVERYGDAPAAFGLILAASGVAAVAGAVAIGQLGLPRNPLRLMYLCWSISALAVAGYGVAGATWQAAGFGLVYGAAAAVTSVAWATLLQTRVPDGLRGRVASVDFVVSLGLTPVSLALVAPAAHVFGAQATMIGAGLAGAGVLTLALACVGRRPRRRDARRVPEAAPAAR